MILSAGSFSAVSGAVIPSNVLVLYNANSADGIETANYYAKVHRGVTLLGLTGVTAAEQITADNYLSVIRPQVLAALNSSIDVIVTTKGLPLRIYTEESNPGTYTDPFGVTRTVGTGWWRQYSSLESELTRIDVISTPQQMGDQTFYSQTAISTDPQPSNNPYYGRSVSFDYGNYYISGYGGMRLTARLDGFTTADVKAAINRAQNAYVMSTAGYVVVDDDPTAGVDRMTQLKVNVLTKYGQTYVYDNTTAAITTAPGPVIGYVSHGTNGGGLYPGYISRQLQFKPANGAVFQTYESYNAYSFQSGGNHDGQGLVAEWLAAGGTAGVGHVEEPYTGSCNVANEDQMFKMLLKGYTWAEAAWSSMQQLSYVNTVVGDPLMTWKRPASGAVTCSCPLYVGFGGTGEFTLKSGGFVVASDVQIGDVSGSAGTFNLEGGTLDLSKPGDTLTVGINGTFNYISGTLNVDTIVVKGDGTNGGRINAVQLIADTLTIGPGAVVTILPIDTTTKLSAAASQDSCVSYSGTTLIEDGFLQINTRTGPVYLNDVIGNGCLSVGDGANATTLIVRSIAVQYLTIGANSMVIIAPVSDASLTGESITSVPEPDMIALTIEGGIGSMVCLWRRKGRISRVCKNFL